VDADDHVVGLVADRIVDDARVEARQLVGVHAALAGVLTLRVVAQIREVGVVELEVAAARIGEAGDLGAVGGGEVGVELLKVRIGGGVDRVAASMVGEGIVTLGVREVQLARNS
jgi:hypothetical protein